MNELYEEIVRRQLLGVDCIYDDFKLGIIDNKVCIVGLRPDFYINKDNYINPLRLTLNGGLGICFDLFSIKNDIYNNISSVLNRKRFMIDLEINNLVKLSSAFFCCDSNKLADFAGINFIHTLILPNTEVLGSRSLCNLGITELIAPKVTYIHPKALLGCNNMVVCKLNSYSDVDIIALKSLVSLTKLKLPDTYSISETKITDWTGKYIIFKFLNINLFEVLTLYCMLEMIDTKVKNVSFDNLEEIVEQTSKNKIVSYSKHMPSINFPKLIKIEKGGIKNAKFSELSFSSLKILDGFIFQNCSFGKLSFSSLEYLGIDTFKSGKCELLELPKLKELDINSFDSFRINTLILNKDCIIKLNHDLYLIANKIVYV